MTEHKKKRRPTAFHRDMWEYIESLPVGEHRFIIDGHAFVSLARLKAEGGMSVNMDGGRLLTVIPDMKNRQKDKP